MKRFLFVLVCVMCLCVASSELYANDFNPLRIDTGPGSVTLGIGQQYNYTFRATGGTGTYSWSCSGAPTGMSMSGSTFSGRCSTEFAGNVTVTVRDGRQDASVSFYLTVTKNGGSSEGGGGNVGGRLTIGGYLHAKHVGTTYPENNYGEIFGKLTADGGTPPYKWSVARGYVPKGMCLGSPVEGEVTHKYNNYVGAYTVLCGNPVREGTYDFTVKVTDSAGQSAIKDCSITIDGGDIDNLEVVFDTDVAFPDAVAKAAGWSYFFSGYSDDGVYARGGRSPYVWSCVAGRLPDGLTLSTTSSGRAQLSGTPEKAGRYNFVLKVVDADGRTAVRAASFTAITDGKHEEYGSTEYYESSPAITGEFITSSTAGQSYSESAAASGGTAPYTWSVSYGELPKGLSLNASTGQITGSPEAEGFYNFTLRVKDSEGNTDAKTFMIKVVGSAASESSNNTPADTTPQNNNSNTPTNIDPENTQVNNTPANTDTENTQASSSGGGGCNSGLGLFALALIIMVKAVSPQRKM